LKGFSVRGRHAESNLQEHSRFSEEMVEKYHVDRRICHRGANQRPIPN
jgi:hypothetical protein